MVAKSILGAALISLFAPSTFAISNSAQVPVLLYHSWEVDNDCSYGLNASLALATDLENAYAAGFRVVPVYWITQWALGERDGSTLPDKIYGITFDDGPDLDWFDSTIGPSSCPNIRSSYGVLSDFKSRHPDLPWYSPFASVFVIASPAARQVMTSYNINVKGWPWKANSRDDWWYSAQNSGLMEIYNHSADHDHESIHGPIADNAIGAYIAVGGYVDLNWNGIGNAAGTGFMRIGNDPDGSTTSATLEVRNSAQYIYSKIGVWPDLFAYPYGNASANLQAYFANHVPEHQTYAAYSTSGNYVYRGASRWYLGRFVYKANWSTPEMFMSILNNGTY